MGGAQARGEYLSGSPVRVGEDKHSLHLRNEGSYEEREGRTPPSEGVDRGDVVVVVPPSTDLS